MEKPAVAPVYFGAFYQPLLNIGVIWMQPPHEIGLLKVVEIRINRMIGYPETLSDLAGIPYISVKGSEHFKKPLGDGRRSIQTPYRKVPHGEQIKIIFFPDREIVCLEEPTVRITTHEPEPFILLGANL